MQSSKYFVALATLIALAPVSQADTILIKFGSSSAVTGFNQLSALPISPTALLNTSNAATGVTLQFAGSINIDFDHPGGEVTPLSYGPDASTAWANAGGTDFSTVISRGTGFYANGTTPGTFTFGGLQVGETYSLTLLLGKEAGGGDTRLAFTGVDPSTVILTGYANATTSPAFTTGANTYQTTETVIGDSLGGAISVQFTAVAPDVDITFNNAGSSGVTAIQGIALTTPVPEPSTYALGAAGLLGGLVLIRRRLKK